jgi:tRNA dimethylallyltransferase
MRRLIAIVGPTATGKSALAVDLAEQLSGEVVNADSRLVYRGMDIGTAKPSPEERARAPHHLIDVRNPDEDFSLAEYLCEARAALDGVWQRDRFAVLVGGTGQYVWALLEGWQVPQVPPDPALRAELLARAEREGGQALAEELARLDPQAAASIDPCNLRRVIRALEVCGKTGRRFSDLQERTAPDFEALVIGLQLPRDQLYERIDQRVDEMFCAGFVDEVKTLRAAGYNRELPSMSSIGYGEVNQLLDGELSLGAGVQHTKLRTHRLARRQQAWFRPDDQRISWFPADGSAASRIELLVNIFTGVCVRARFRGRGESL